MANYFFGLGSSVLVALVITLVVDKVLARRTDLEPDEPVAAPNAAELEAIEVTAQQRRALRVTGLVALGFIAFLALAMVPSSSPLRGEGGSIVDSPLIGGMALVLGVFFAVLGTVYGRMTGTFSASRDTIAAMVDGTRSMAPILVLFFAISQFLAYFKWTNIGNILAVKGAETAAWPGPARLDRAGRHRRADHVHEPRHHQRLRAMGAGRAGVRPHADADRHRARRSPRPSTASPTRSPTASPR